MPSKFTHQGAWSTINASFLRDIDWSCGISSSDIAADAMPAGMSWGSSATSCQWSWWLMSLTQIKKNSLIIKSTGKNYRKGSFAALAYNRAWGRRFDKPDLTPAKLSEPWEDSGSPHTPRLDGRSLRPSSRRRRGLRAFRSTQDRRARGTYWAVPRGHHPPRDTRPYPLTGG